MSKYLSKQSVNQAASNSENIDFGALLTLIDKDFEVNISLNVKLHSNL